MGNLAFSASVYVYRESKPFLSYNSYVINSFRQYYILLAIKNFPVHHSEISQDLIQISGPTPHPLGPNIAPSRIFVSDSQFFINSSHHHRLDNWFLLSCPIPISISLSLIFSFPTYHIISTHIPHPHIERNTHLTPASNNPSALLVPT